MEPLKDSEASGGQIAALETQPGHDDELLAFEAHGAAPLPPGDEGRVENEGAQIWYASYGAGRTVILLHGGLGNSENWGNQVPALLKDSYRVVVIDSRGHGRSTRDGRPFSYELMASDVLAVMDALEIEKAWLVGWSDGACIALVLGDRHPSRVNGVVFFACNMDPSGAKVFKPSTVIDRCLKRHRTDYTELSATPNDFDDFMQAVSSMQRTQPDYSSGDLAGIAVPVLVLHAEFDEFIKFEHAKYLAEMIPQSRFELLRGVSHFAPVQRPEQFNAVMLAFLTSAP